MVGELRLSAQRREQAHLLRLGMRVTERCDPRAVPPDTVHVAGLSGRTQLSCRVDDVGVLRPETADQRNGLAATVWSRLCPDSLTRPHLTLDAVESIERNLDAVLTYLRSPQEDPR